MTAVHPASAARLTVRIGAVLFFLWGVLHIWVGYAGVSAYLAGLGTQWSLLIGGVNVPRTAFMLPSDAPTALAQSQLLINFCLDVAGYGVLALFVAWGLWTRSSWAAFAIGAVVIGICDLAFSFSLVTPGVIEKTLPVVAGPILWFLAIIVTPLGLYGLRSDTLRVQGSVRARRS
jgi:hypothetical protein